MFGQTNCWILPDGDYGAYAHNDKEILCMAERAAMNVSFQGEKNGYTGEVGAPDCLVKFKGKELFGAALHAPLCKYKVICRLPPNPSPNPSPNSNSKYQVVYCLPLLLNLES